MGDPLEIRLRGYELALRKDDAARIELVGIHDTDTGPRANAAIGTTDIRPWARDVFARCGKDGRAGARRCTFSPATKTAVRPRCSTSLRAPASVGNFPRRDGRPQGRHYP